MKNVAIIVKLSKLELNDAFIKIIDLLKHKEMNLLIPTDIVDYFNLSIPSKSIEDIRLEADCVIVLGGDGTLLHTAELFKNIDIPILPFNLGRLGFLMELDLHNIEYYIDAMINNQLNIKERMKLSSSIYKADELLSENEVLNEIVLNKNIPAKILEIEIKIESVVISRCRADGLIISTPTGSTGYALSAGGPIIYPELDAILIAPICPHALYMRPIIIPSTSVLSISITSISEAYITYDGRDIHNFTHHDKIVVKRSPSTLKLVVDSNKNFYSILKKKLGWGGDFC